VDGSAHKNTDTYIPVDAPPARLLAQAVAAAASHKDLAGRAALPRRRVEQGQEAAAVLEEDDRLARQLQGHGLVGLGPDRGFHVRKVVEHVQGVV
jgi:hypothetical protein